MYLTVGMGQQDNIQFIFQLGCETSLQNVQGAVLIIESLLKYLSCIGVPTENLWPNRYLMCLPDSAVLISLVHYKKNKQ